MPEKPYTRREKDPPKLQASNSLAGRLKKNSLAGAPEKLTSN